MKSFFLAVVGSGIVALAVLDAGCVSAPVRLPRSTLTVGLSPDHAAPEVEIDVLTAVRIVLPGPLAGSDLVWEIGSNNNKVLEQMGSLKAERVGGAPATTTSFYALKPGRSDLRFFLVRPGQAEVVPTAACTLAVRVND